MLDKISDILQALQHAMPMMQRYVNLLPASLVLRSIARDLYDIYVAYLIDTIHYLKRNPICERCLQGYHSLPG